MTHSSPSRPIPSHTSVPFTFRHHPFFSFRTRCKFLSPAGGKEPPAPRIPVLLSGQHPINAAFTPSFLTHKHLMTCGFSVLFSIVKRIHSDCSLDKNVQVSFLWGVFPRHPPPTSRTSPRRAELGPLLNTLHYPT